MGLHIYVNRRWNFTLGCHTRLLKFAKYSYLLGCERQWLSPLLTAAGGLTATFNDRVVTIQFECARFHVSSNMLVCVVSRFIGWCII